MNTNEKVEIKISDVLDLLEEGKGRKEIAEHYGIPMSDVKLMFEHEKLKGKRPKKVKEPSFMLVDDTAAPQEEEVENTNQEESMDHELDQAMNEDEVSEEKIVEEEIV